MNVFALLYSLARPKVESECFSPFVYRLPVSMYELGIQHKLENQIRRFRGLEMRDLNNTNENVHELVPFGSDDLDDLQ